ncbi:MAG: peptidylprolyl isomerase, partial [Chloroflexota bacterium]|nr:peptidylprolyl isomerase [Chloroflexota bacterium]
MKFLIISFLTAIGLAACVLQTPSPEPTVEPAAPTAAPAVAPTLPLASISSSSQSADSAPVKQMVNAGGVLIPQYFNAPPVTIDPTTKYSATIRTSMGNLEVELFAERSPITVNNFIFLANDGFYDGIIFH